MTETLSKAEKFYVDYIQDNPTFKSMPQELWDVVHNNIASVYELWITLSDDEWRAAEIAVRRYLNSRGLDSETW